MIQLRKADNTPLGAIQTIAVTFSIVFALACSTDTPSSTPSSAPLRVPADVSQITVGTVVGVIDGATIDVETDGKVTRVRYLGLEVPGPDEASLGERARDFNSHLVAGQIVQMEKGVVDTDPFGLALRYVYVGGEMANQALLTNGYATVASFPPNFKHRSSFELAEEGARRERRGVWTARTAPTPAPGQQEPEATIGPFTGGTLPLPPGVTRQTPLCEYSGTTQPVIKGNVDTRTGELIYYVPGGFFYSTSEVSLPDGDRWFCTEAEALAAGWTRSKH